MDDLKREDGPEAQRVVPIVASCVAQALEQTQIAKYHTKGGHGFAAEDANHFADSIRGIEAELVGKSNSVNGADRAANGIQIQCKYCQTASQTVAAAFDSGGGAYRYPGQSLEVPSDQYEACVELMRERIASGRVPGVSKPEQAERIVRKGSVTYKQARNIARAGNVDSVFFDAKTQAVTAGAVCTISSGVAFAQSVWRGESVKEAARASVVAGVASGGTAFIVGVATAQTLRTRVAAVGATTARRGVKVVSSSALGRSLVRRVATGSLGKAISGAAAVNHVAKLLRTNAITAAVATIATSSPDVYRAAFERSVSWTQLAKNTAVNGVGIAGGTGGWLAGAAAGASVGSIVPVIGTAAGGVIGGFVGSIGGSTASTFAIRAAADKLIDDDSVQMIAVVRQTVEMLAHDFCLGDEEIVEVAEVVKRTVTPNWLRQMFKQGPAEDALRAFVCAQFEPHFEAIAKRRPQIRVPSADDLGEELAEIVQQTEQCSGNGNDEVSPSA